MVKTLHFQCRGVGSFPGWRNEIPHATQLGQKKKKKIKNKKMQIENSSETLSWSYNTGKTLKSIISTIHTVAGK